MDKTRDIQDNIKAMLAREGQQTERELVDRAAELGTDDPRWVMVALMRLRLRQEISYPACGCTVHGHEHGDDCTVELVGS